MNRPAPAMRWARQAEPPRGQGSPVSLPTKKRTVVIAQATKGNVSTISLPLPVKIAVGGCSPAKKAWI